MEHLIACRICLATNVKLYEMCKYRLKTAYENLTGIDMSLYNFPECVCSYCGTMLSKFSSFRSKCKRSQQLLETLLAGCKEVSTSLIKSFDTTSYKLSLPYTIHLIQNFDSTIAVKDEFDDRECVKIDNNFDNFSDDADFENVKFDIVKDTQSLDDTDEEPLSKKVKKKRKKKSFRSKYDDIVIKTEDFYLRMDHQNSYKNYNQNVSQINNQNNLREQNLATDDKKLLTAAQNLLTADQNLLTVDQNLLPADQNLLTVNQNLLTADQNLLTVDQNLSTEDHAIKNQVFDLETDHKLIILSQREQIDEVNARKTSANYMNSVYKCDNCYKGFMTDSTFKNHMARHDPCCGPVACPVCDTRWPDARSLRAHSLISHERRYICKVCGHISKSGHKAKEHSQWHAGFTFPCDKCGQTFIKSTSYLTHVRLRHASHACPLCGQSFIGLNGLNMHRKKAHREQKTMTSSLHSCVRCQVNFLNTAALKRHYDVTYNNCDQTLHVCTQCGDHFDTEQILSKHIDVHKKKDAVRTCSQCDRSFVSERSLASHVYRAHSTRRHARDTVCEVCGHKCECDRSFVSERSHASHVYRTHSTRRYARNTVCEVCGHKCESASSLVNHQRVHTGEKPYACTLCHKRFSVAQRLQIHLRTHTGERPFQCSRCPKAFKHKAALNRHDRVHTGVKPYSCPHCGKRFSQSNSMKQHAHTQHMTHKYSHKSKHTVHNYSDGN